MAYMDVLILLQTLPDAPIFGLNQQTFITMIIILINTCILAFVLSKLLYKPVLQMLHDRRARILEEIQTTQKNKEDALKLKAEYEQMMMGITEEKQQILEAARKQAAERSQEQLAEARSEAEVVKARALKEIALEQERAKSEMKQTVIDLSSLVASKFITKAIDADSHDQLFNETMAELEEMAWHN